MKRFGSGMSFWNMRSIFSHALFLTFSSEFGRWYYFQLGESQNKQKVAAFSVVMSTNFRLLIGNALYWDHAEDLPRETGPDFGIGIRHPQHWPDRINSWFGCCGPSTKFLATSNRRAPVWISMEYLPN
jgi:hypothetical protein